MVIELPTGRSSWGFCSVWVATMKSAARAMAWPKVYNVLDVKFESYSGTLQRHIMSENLKKSSKPVLD